MWAAIWVASKTKKLGCDITTELLVACSPVLGLPDPADSAGIKGNIGLGNLQQLYVLALPAMP